MLFRSKFYAYLIEKLIEARKELKFSIQYAFWDQFKLLENFSLRKIANLAKLMAFLMGKSLGLNSLKGLELTQENQHISAFFTIFLKSFLNKDDDKKELLELITKLKQNEENLSFFDELITSTY